MRTHIAKSLQTRCKTIQRAVKEYNVAAAALDPPRPALDWSQVTNFNFLEEFALLQDTRNDIRDKPWSKPAIRETMKLRHRLARAREEVDRLNVEVRRLHTAIHDETQLFDDTLARLKANKDSVLGPTLDFVTRRKRLNDHLLTRIKQVYALKGFSGTKGPGQRLGGAVRAPTVVVPDGLLTMPEIEEDLIIGKVDEGDEDGEDPDELGDDEQEEIDGLVQFISELAL